MESKLQTLINQGAYLNTPNQKEWLLYAKYEVNNQLLTTLSKPINGSNLNLERHKILVSSIDGVTGKLYFAYSETEYVQIIPVPFDNISQHREALEQTYLHLTNIELPKWTATYNWPINENHCFQRVLLDHLFQKPWRDSLPNTSKPAYRQLKNQQLGQATFWAYTFIYERPADLLQYNAQSLRYRKENLKP